MIALILCYLTRTEAIKSIKTMKHCFILKTKFKNEDFISYNIPRKCDIG